MLSNLFRTVSLANGAYVVPLRGYHVDVAVIFSVRITPMWSVDLDELAEVLSSAIDVNLLIWITDTHVFLVLATIEFHK